MTGPPVQRLVADQLAHLVGLGGGPVVAVEEARTNGLAAGVEGRDRGALAGEPNRLHAPGHDLIRPRQLRERGQRRLTPAARVLLGAARPRRLGRIGTTRLVTHAAVEVDSGSTRARGADVDGYEQRIGCHHPRTSWCALSLSPERVTSTP